MDKYEFNIKVEQIKKLITRGDYDTAMKIADTIDWRRVRNASLLSQIAQIYEKNGEYQEAKDILLLAFERAPVSKRILYKLAELALKEDNITEAEAYYREFCDLAQDDPRQLLLRYLILKSKNAPLDQLIRALEGYTANEMDEKWLYELAELYHEAGKEEACVKTCDKIMLMFGLGKYVDKAMDLKQVYAPLNSYQQDLVQNHDKYAARLRAVEEEFNEVPVRKPVKEKPVREKPAPRARVISEREESAIVANLHEDAEEKRLAREMSRLAKEPVRTAEVEEEYEDDADETRMLDDLKTIKNIIPTQRVLDAQAERAEEERRARERAEAEERRARERAEEERELQRHRAAIRAAKEREEMEEEELRRIEQAREEARREEEERRRAIEARRERESAALRAEEYETEEYEAEEPDEAAETNHLMIEAADEKEGVELALSALREIHAELGIHNPVAKIDSSKLNKRGIAAVADILAGKDILILNAAELTAAVQNELDEFMERDRSGMIVVLIDTPENLEYLHGHHASLASKFQYIGSEESYDDQEEAYDDREDDRYDQEEAYDDREDDRYDQEEAYDDREDDRYDQEEAYDDHEDDRYDQEEAYDDREDDRYDQEEAYDDREDDRYDRRDTYRQEEYEDEEIVEEPVPAAKQPVSDEEVMTADEFAEYACRYASEIDCSITGKSKLALYERIEMMEEDEVPLTREAAIDLIEEAADKAENPSFSKKLTGLFSSKYNKEGLLILHEDNFFD